VGLTILVFAKQVPDTKNITGDAMKEDGTVNRGALPAIFNPEDLNALEMALQLRDNHGGKVVLFTMGPPGAVGLLREGLYIGADEAVLLTDRAFAGADTLATSYTLACAAEKYGGYDLVLTGRQAIDGDTAQVGPQLAEKLKLPQLTYVEEVTSVDDGRITTRCLIEGGDEVLESPMPALLTVTATANTPRPPGARRLMQYKKAMTRSELSAKHGGSDYEDANILAEEEQRLRRNNLWIHEWTGSDIGAESGRLGIPGSPTKVKNIESVVVGGERELRNIPSDQKSLDDLMHELIGEHILS